MKTLTKEKKAGNEFDSEEEEKNIFCILLQFPFLVSFSRVGNSTHLKFGVIEY